MKKASRVVSLSSRPAALLACIIFALLSLASLGAQKDNLSWGLATVRDADHSLRVSWVQPSGLAWDRGIRPGDRVIAVGGRTVSEVLPFGALSDPDRTSPLLLSDSRRSATYEFQWPTGEPDTGIALSLLFVGAIFIGTGVFVFLHDPQGRAARAFFIHNVAAAMVFACTPNDYSPGYRWNTILMFGFAIFYASTFAYLFLVFPERRTITVRGWPILPYGVFLLPAVLIAYFLAATIWAPEIYEPGRNLTSASYAVLVLLGMVALILNYFRSSRVETRYQLRLVVAGTLIAIFPLLAFNMIPAALGHDFLAPAPISVLSMVLIPLTFTYAILRYQLLGTGHVIHRGLVSFAIWAILFISYFLVSLTVAAFGRNTIPLHVYLLQAVFLGGVAFLAPQVQGRIKTLVDRSFFKDVYDYERTLQSLTAELGVARDASEMADCATLRVVEIMNLSYALMLVRQPKGNLKVIASTPNCDKKTQSRICEVASTDLAPGENKPIEIAADRSEPVLYVPLRSGDLLTGFFCLGPKANGSEFTRQDHALLQTLAGQVSIGLDNVRLLKDVQQNLRRSHATAQELAASRSQLKALNQRLMRAHEEERAKLAADIHDEPLQRIILLQRQLGNCGYVEAANICPYRATVAEAAKDLRQVCTSLHPSVLDDLGLAPALDFLVAEAKKVDSLSTLFIDQDQVEERLPIEVETALFRVAQEAINNCLSHAQATELVVRFWRDQETVILSVTDNGRGFHPSVDGTDLVAAGHLGLVGMRERISLIGGRLDVLSAPGQGTEILARLEFSKRQDQQLDLDDTADLDDGG